MVALNDGKDMLEVLSLNETMTIDPKGSGEKPKDSVIELSEKEKEVAKSTRHNWLH